MQEAVIGLKQVMLKLQSEIDEAVEIAVKDSLHDIAQTAVSLSPVDTGAYVNSFSFSVGAGLSRGLSSDDKPKGKDPTSERQSSLSNLVSDINKITDLNSRSTITLRNASPHATDVENGGPNWRRAGYKVFAKIRDIYG